MKPIICSLTSQGVEVLLTVGNWIVIEDINTSDYWFVHEQLRAWDLGLSGDEILVEDK